MNDPSLNGHSLNFLYHCFIFLYGIEIIGFIFLLMTQKYKIVDQFLYKFKASIVTALSLPSTVLMQNVCCWSIFLNQ